MRTCRFCILYIVLHLRFGIYACKCASSTRVESVTQPQRTPFARYVLIWINVENPGSCLFTQRYTINSCWWASHVWRRCVAPHSCLGHWFTLCESLTPIYLYIYEYITRHIHSALHTFFRQSTTQTATSGGHYSVYLRASHQPENWSFLGFRRVFLG